MQSEDTGSTAQYIVLINHEEQYSIWPAGKKIPPGWEQVGPTGSEEECVAYVDEHWTDMRPKSLREEMARRAGGDGSDS
jgi:MbtH protein